MLAVRHQYPQFATGSFEVLPADNPSVLAYVRQARAGDSLCATSQAWASQPGESAEVASAQRTEVPDSDDQANLSDPPDLDGAPAAVLCVSNLSRFAQPAELSLGRWEGSTPIELLGRVPFPKITVKPYSVTLAPYGIYWFELVER
jgi:hypothetical protein